MKCESVNSRLADYVEGRCGSITRARIRRPGLPLVDRTEAAPPGAHRSQDHESGRASGKTLPEIRAMCTLAHGSQIPSAQLLFHAAHHRPSVGVNLEGFHQLGFIDEGRGVRFEPEAAFFSHDEETRGSIALKCQADFTVIEGDRALADDASVWMTIKGGEVVYEAGEVSKD